MIEKLSVRVVGRPAPQGSKKRGSAGQMREQSPYLPAWRAAVKRAVYEQYQALGVEPADLPVFDGAVRACLVFYLDPARAITGPPDVDKLQRAVFDALKDARVYVDDSRVIHVSATKVRAVEGEATGALIVIERLTS